jgi:hypothetical protein
MDCPGISERSLGRSWSDVAGSVELEGAQDVSGQAMVVSVT